MPPLHRYLGNPVLSFIGRLFFRTRVRRLPLRPARLRPRRGARAATCRTTGHGVRERDGGEGGARRLAHRRGADHAASRTAAAGRRTCAAGATAGATCASCCCSARAGCSCIPGLALLALGIALTTALYFAPLRVLGAGLDIHSMLYASAGGAARPAALPVRAVRARLGAERRAAAAPAGARAAARASLTLERGLLARPGGRAVRPALERGGVLAMARNRLRRARSARRDARHDSGDDPDGRRHGGHARLVPAERAAAEGRRLMPSPMVSGHRALAGLAMDSIFWLGMPAVFLFVCIDGHLLPAGAVAPHLRIVISLLLGLAVFRLTLSVAGLNAAAARAASALAASAMLAVMLSYYLLTVIGLQTWGRVVSWELIASYGGQAFRLAETLGISVPVAIGAAGLAYLALLAAAWGYLGHFDWAPLLRRKLSAPAIRPHRARRRHGVRNRALPFPGSSADPPIRAGQPDALSGRGGVGFRGPRHRSAASRPVRRGRRARRAGATARAARRSTGT